MVWRPPGEVERGKQTRWRAVVVWSLFLVLTGAALATQVVTARAGLVALGEPLEVGPMTVRLPAGWTTTTDPSRPLAAAATMEGEAPQTLEIRLEASEWSDPRSYFLAEFGDAIIEAPRRVTVAGRPGLMVSAIGVIGPMRHPVTQTVAAAEVGPGVILRVELRRIGDWRGSDAVLVRQVADAIRVADRLAVP